MKKEKIMEYKKSLKTPYTGMTEDLMNEIEGIEVKEDDVNYDLNGDGVVDAKDRSIAGKVLASSRSKKTRKVK